MAFKILAVAAALLVAARFVTKQVSEARQRTRYPIAAVLGGVLLWFMFAGLAFMVFVEDDDTMSTAAIGTLILAVAGSGLLVFAHGSRRS